MRGKTRVKEAVMGNPQSEIWIRLIKSLLKQSRPVTISSEIAEKHVSPSITSETFFFGLRVAKGWGNLFDPR